MGLLSAAGGSFAPNDGNAIGAYVERYVYDVAGNVLRMKHRGSDPASPGWTRAFDYSEPSLTEAGKTGNRVTGTMINAASPIAVHFRIMPSLENESSRRFLLCRANPPSGAQCDR